MTGSFDRLWKYSDCKGEDGVGIVSLLSASTCYQALSMDPYQIRSHSREVDHILHMVCLARLLNSMQSIFYSV